jgi:hypothetical protein
MHAFAQKLLGRPVQMRNGRSPLKQIRDKLDASPEYVDTLLADRNIMPRILCASRETHTRVLELVLSDSLFELRFAAYLNAVQRGALRVLSRILMTLDPFPLVDLGSLIRCVRHCKRQTQDEDVLFFSFLPYCTITAEGRAPTESEQDWMDIKLQQITSFTLCSIHGLVGRSKHPVHEVDLELLQMLFARMHVAQHQILSEIENGVSPLELCTETAMQLINKVFRMYS